MKNTKRLILPLIFILLTASVLLFTACGGECKDGHTEVVDAAVAPTCQNEGLTEGSHCTVCNEVIKKQEKLPKLEHKAGGFALVESENKITSTCTSCPEVFETYKAEKLIDAWSTAWAAEGKTELDLTAFALVYQSDSKGFIADVNTFANSVFEKTGVKITPVLASKYNSSEFSGAIFVGETGLDESKDAQKVVEAGYSYAVLASDKKLTVVGRANEDVVAALNFVVANYLTTYTNKVSFPICTIGTNPRYVTIDASEFYLVIDHNTYDVPGHAYVGGSDKECTDYNYRLATSFATRIGIKDKIIKDSLTLPNRAYVSVYGGKTYEERTKVINDTTTHLIFFGEVNHPVSISFRANLPANCHGFKIIDEETIVVAAHNDIGLEKAMNLFRKEYMASKDKTWPAGYTSIEVTDESWIVDFPRPANENIRLYNTQISTADTLQLLYTGSGISEEAFDAYCETLEKAGYVLYGTVTQFAENKYATFVNESKNSALHVAYNPFAHQDDLAALDSGLEKTRKMTTGSAWGSKSYTVVYPLISYDPCIRVISAPLDGKVALPADATKPFSNNIASSVAVKLPGKELLTKDYSYKKVTETSITAVGLPSGAIGTSYVIQLEDGSFIVIDGGYRKTDMNKQNDEGDILYKVLSQLHENAFKDEGTVPSIITIRAWYLTHSHYDHFYNFGCFMYQYGKGERYSDQNAKLVDDNYKVDVQNVLAHIVNENLQNMNKGNELMLSASYISAINYANGGGTNYIRTHAGQVLHFANVTLEVLMTPEDYNPMRISNTNDTNTIINFKISSKDDQQNEVNFLSTGDSCIYQGRYLCVSFGEYLESDMASMAHHGNIGTETSFYQMVKAKYIWYPNSVSSFKSYTTGSSAWPINVSSALIKMDCLKYVYISGSGATWNDTATIKNGIATVSVKFDKATPIYDKPHDVMSNDALVGIGTSRGELNDSKVPVYKNPNYKEN